MTLKLLAVGFVVISIVASVLAFSGPDAPEYKLNCRASGDNESGFVYVTIENLSKHELNIIGLTHC